MPQSMGLQIVRHDWVTEQQQYECVCVCVCAYILHVKNMFATTNFQDLIFKCVLSVLG